MFRSRRSKEKGLYYLLPGMGRSNRRYHTKTLWWAILVGLIASAIFGVTIFLLNRP